MSHRRGYIRGIAAALLLGYALTAAGCGGSGAQPAAGTKTAAKHPSPAAHEKNESRAVIVAAVNACKGGVDMATWLSKKSKAQMYANCENGLRRGLTEIRWYGLEVCSEVAFTSPAKTDAERQQLAARCYQGTKEKTAMIGE
jgi:hypothetical protein